MIFSLFLFQSISIACGTVTNVHDIDNLISSYLSNTIDQHALHATSHDYMKIVQEESNLTTRYFQTVRYILHGFPITNDTNDNAIVYKKLNFIQSIAYFYCGINMSYVINTSLDDILIDETQLYMNSLIFPVQFVESYQLIRSEICQRIKLGLYQSIVYLFNPYIYAESLFSDMVGNVANFVSFNTHESFFLSLQSIGQIYPFLAKFGEFELYKEAVIDHIWKIDSSLALKSTILGKAMKCDIGICVNRIKYPRMRKYVTTILNSTSMGNKSFILNQYNTNDFWYYVDLYKLSTGTAAIENNTVEIGNMLQLLDECRRKTKLLLSGATLVDCTLIAFGIYESREDDTDGHEYVLDAIKYIISNHDLYYSKFGSLANQTDYEFKSTLTNNLRQSLSEDVFYPYLDELMNDTQFVNIVNNNTDSQIDAYLQKILSNLMMVAFGKYNDIEMIKKIATVFKSKINVCTPCIFKSKYAWDSMMISWMGVLKQHQSVYLIEYFQQVFKHQVEDCSRK